MKNDVFDSVVVGDGDTRIAGVSLKELAKECPTPLYIYDEDRLVKTMHAYTDHFTSPKFEGRVVYATKAFNCKAMLRLCQKNGLYMDSVSLGEIYTAHKAGIDMSGLYFHGNNKTVIEMRRAFEYGVGTLIVDSLEESEKLARIASEYPDCSMRILIRVNPIIEAATHKHIQTATPDSKFGIAIDRKDNVLETIRTIQSAPNLHFAGLHAHIGSQIFGSDPFTKEVDDLTDYMVMLRDEHGIHCEELDLGGGFGVWYNDADTPAPVEDVCRTIVSACEKAFAAKNLTPSVVTIEPGRSIVAEAGYLLYEITLIKKALKDTFYFVDGGMSDLIRPALYEAVYSADLVGKPADAPKQLVTIGGKCCESGDIVIRDIELPVAKEGDLLLVYSAGAYGYSMANNYNKNPLPGVVFVKDGTWRYVVRPESLDDMIARECD